MVRGEPLAGDNKKSKQSAGSVDPQVSPEKLMELTSKVGVLANSLDRNKSLAEVTAFLEQSKSDPFLVDLFIHMAKEIMADHSRNEPSELDEGPNKGVVAIRLEDRKLIQTNVRSFKMMLKIMVDRKGGVKWLADQLDVSVPNISRFFNTDSMPRQSTLAQIFEVLGIDEVKIPVNLGMD